MTWLQRHRLRSFLKNSIWLMPILGMIFAITSARALLRLDAALGWKAEHTVDASRAVLGALVSAMLTFIVFVFSMLLVAVQLASAQLSPRIIGTAFRDRLIKVALTVFVFTFAFTLVVLSRIDDSVPRITIWVATYSNIACLCIYIYLIDHVGRMLRPLSLLGRVAAAGRAVIEEVYPRRIVGDASIGLTSPEHFENAPSRTIDQFSDGVFLAFDQSGLVEIARSADCVIEIVPQVGDFVAKGNPLFRLYGGTSITERDLRQTVMFGAERTMEQDPAFAFRIIVDIASKALSAAINDPTTAVMALDQLHHLLRSLGMRELDTGRICDESGRLRLVYRTPDWEDFVVLAVTEIRHYGGASIQVARRLRAMLEDLTAAVIPERVPPLRQEIMLLQRSVQQAFSEPEDRVRADIGDSQGIGGHER